MTCFVGGKHLYIVFGEKMVSGNFLEKLTPHLYICPEIIKKIFGKIFIFIIYLLDMKYIITEDQFNFVNLSDLSKKGHWDPKRHVRKLKGIDIYTIEDGALKKREKMPQGRVGRGWGYTSKKIYYLTNEEADEVNVLLTQAREMESEAKKLRDKAKSIYLPTESNI